MEAIILAGGKGTRLKPYTTVLPKPLMPVGEHPILEIVLRQLHKAGVTKVTLAVNHMADLIMAYFGNGSRIGVDISYSIEDKPLSTIAPIKLIQDLPDNSIVMNGDILTDIDYRALYSSHTNSNALLTIATYKRDVKIDFGVMQVDPTNRNVIGFREKPIYHFEVSMGIYILSKKILDIVPKDTPFGFDDLVLNMLREKQPINSYLFDGYWLDIGRPDDFDRANIDFQEKKGWIE